MKVKYIGEDFGILGLRNGKIYECLGVEYGLFRIINESGEEDGCLYDALNPRPLNGSSPGGKWEIIEDDDQGTLQKTLDLWAIARAK